MKQLNVCIELKKQIKHLKRKNANAYWRLISSHMDEISWEDISHNINVTDIEHKIKTMNTIVIESASINPNLTLDFVVNNSYNLTWKWNWFWVSKTVKLPHNISFEKYNKYLVIDGISRNPSLNMHHILSNINMDWNWKAISNCPNITMTFINSICQDYFDWNCLSCNPAIHLNDIIENPTKPWSYRFLSRNPNLRLDFVKQHLNNQHTNNITNNQHTNNNTNNQHDISNHDHDHNDDHNQQSEGRSNNINVNNVRDVDRKVYEWDWYYISRHAMITLADVDHNPQLPWSYFGLSRNINMTCEWVKAHPHDRWNYYWLSKTIHITDIEQHIHDMYFNWSGISSNITITGEFILKHKHELNWHELSCNPGLDLDFVIRHDTLPWSWSCIAGNRFDHNVKKLELLHAAAVDKLAKEFYWRLVQALSKPPNGYYFKQDLQHMLQLQAS